MKHALRIAGFSALYLSIPGMIAWVTGSLFIFPSLGPTAYILAFDTKRIYTPSVVIGGHVCGVIGGLTGYLIAGPASLLQLSDPLSAVGLQLVAGAVIALLITAFLMVRLQVSHPPAGATTLIVSLGIMPHWLDGATILLAVSVMFSAYRFCQRFLPAE